MKKEKTETTETTMTAFSDKHRLDRRSVKRWIGECGLQPTRHHRGAIYYNESALINALSDHIKARVKPKTDNILRVISQGAVKSFIVDNLGFIAALAYVMATKRGMAEKEARDFARALWVFSAGEAGDWIAQDKFNTIFTQEAGMTIDQMWEKFGYHDESRPPQLGKISFPLPKCIIDWNKLDDMEFADPLPMGDGKPEVEGAA